MKPRLLLIVLCLLLLVQASGAAAGSTGTSDAAVTTVDGFMGIPWGASEAQVKQELLAKYQFELVDVSPGYENSAILFLNGGYFAGYKPYNIQIFFTFGQMVNGIVRIQDLNPDCYKEIVAKLNTKYGLPYEEKQTDYGSDIVWLIPNGDKKPYKISATIYDGMFITVQYVNEALEGELKGRVTENI